MGFRTWKLNDQQTRIMNTRYLILIFSLMLLGIGAMPQNKETADEPPTAENGGDMRAEEIPDAAIKAEEENNAETERQQEEEPPMEPLESADLDERIEDEDERFEDEEDLTNEDERLDEEEDLTNKDEKFDEEEDLTYEEDKFEED